MPKNYTEFNEKTLAGIEKLRRQIQETRLNQKITNGAKDLKIRNLQRAIEARKLRLNQRRDEEKEI